MHIVHVERQLQCLSTISVSQLCVPLLTCEIKALAPHTSGPVPKKILKMEVDDLLHGAMAPPRAVACCELCGRKAMSDGEEDCEQKFSCKT